MFFHIQTLQILSDQFAVAFAFRQLTDSLLNFILLLAHMVIIAVAHTILFAPVFLTLLFQSQKPSCNIVKLLLLLFGKCFDFLHIRQIRSHQGIFPGQQIHFLGSICYLLKTICNIAASLFLVLKIHVVPVVNNILPVLRRLLIFLFLSE